MTHHLHQSGLSGGFFPLNLPPSDGAPEPIATAIDTYIALREQRKKLTQERAALAGLQPERLADERDARLAAERKPAKHRKALEAKRAATSHAIAGVQVQLDDTLLTLIDAVETHRRTWQETLATVKADAEARSAQALEVVHQQGTRITEASRLADWLTDFPDRCKWSGDIQPIPDELATPISTLARFIRGDISANQIGIAKPFNADAA